MRKILLHACCAPCAGQVLEELTQRGFKITVFFYNPNIYPEKEYYIRRDEIKAYCLKKQFEFIEGDYGHSKWLEQVKHLAQEPEGGKRCELCYECRLRKTAEYASQQGFQIFASTLSISPHKKAGKINAFGCQLAQKYDLEFYVEDWKKKDGFKKSCQISHRENFYRQTYCGCEFSLAQSMLRKK